jgi:hypothetical protein
MIGIPAAFFIEFFTVFFSIDLKHIYQSLTTATASLGIKLDYIAIHKKQPLLKG